MNMLLEENDVSQQCVWSEESSMEMASMRAPLLSSNTFEYVQHGNLFVPNRSFDLVDQGSEWNQAMHCCAVLNTMHFGFHG